MGPLFHALLERPARRAGYLLIAVVVFGYGWIALRGPQGIEALREKHREIRQLQEQNAELARENQEFPRHIVSREILAGIGLREPVLAGLAHQSAAACAG